MDIIINIKILLLLLLFDIYIIKRKWILFPQFFFTSFLY